MNCDNAINGRKLLAVQCWGECPGVQSRYSQSHPALLVAAGTGGMLEQRNGTRTCAAVILRWQRADLTDCGIHSYKSLVDGHPQHSRACLYSSFSCSYVLMLRTSYNFLSQG